MKDLIPAFIASLALFSGGALAQSAAEMQRLKELDQRCHKAREAKLKVLQAEKISECINVERKSKAECEQYWEGYGWGQALAGGGRLQRFYDDIPECVEAHNAWQNPQRYGR